MSLNERTRKIDVSIIWEKMYKTSTGELMLAARRFVVSLYKRTWMFPIVGEKLYKTSTGELMLAARTFGASLYKRTWKIDISIIWEKLYKKKRQLASLCLPQGRSL